MIDNDSFTFSVDGDRMLIRIIGCFSLFLGQEIKDLFVQIRGQVKDWIIDASDGIDSEGYKVAVFTNEMKAAHQRVALVAEGRIIDMLYNKYGFMNPPLRFSSLVKAKAYLAS